MKLHNHCQLNVARAVISLANQDLSKYRINKIIGISKGKMQRCLNSCEIKTSKPNLLQPWKGPWIKPQGSLRLFQVQRDEAKQHRAYAYAIHAATIYQDFSNFCQSTSMRQKSLATREQDQLMNLLRSCRQQV